MRPKECTQLKVRTFGYFIKEAGNGLMRNGLMAWPPRASPFPTGLRLFLYIGNQL